jgi:hypothetical protein
MSKFHLFQNIVSSIQKAIVRFPLECITALVGMVTTIILSEQGDQTPSFYFYTKIAMTCSLCFVSFFSISLGFSGSNNRVARFLSSLLAGILVFLFVFQFSEKITKVEMLQFIVLNITLHLLVSFSAFIKNYNQESFWEFNKQLFLRILVTGLYSFVLFLGLSLAILAVNQLFYIELYEKIYFHLWLIIAIGFSTVFFLAGVPEMNSSNAQLTLNYPNGLKKFTQFVLLPLISIYLSILVIYEIKILITLTLPMGWVSYLILVFALFGILSFLLVYPIAKQKENRWMHTFNRWFYFLLVPLLGLLFWAILYRINLYGITHERYYVLILSLWLSSVVLYFILEKQPKIKFIPISLFFTGIISIAGPQSADTISKKSQLDRFESYIKIIDTKELNDEQKKDLSSIVDFIESNYGIDPMIPLANGKLDQLKNTSKKPNSVKIMKALGTSYSATYENSKPNENQYHFRYNGNTIENIQGYDFSISANEFNEKNQIGVVTIANAKYNIKTITKKYGLDLQINTVVIPVDLLTYIISNPNFRQGDNNSDTKIIQEIELPKHHLKILYQSASAHTNLKEKSLDGYQIKILVKLQN